MSIPKGGLTVLGGQGYFNHALTAMPIQNGYAQALYTGDPVRTSANGIKIGLNTATVVGVFQGCFYLSDTTKLPVYSPYWPASTSATTGTLEGYTQPHALVHADPKARMIIAANTSVAIASFGGLARVTLAGTGSTTTGRSLAAADTSGTAVSAANAMFRIIGVPQIPLPVSAGQSPAVTLSDYYNTWGATPTYLEVTWSNHLYG